MGKIEIGGKIIEWDDKKAELNVKKHRVYFEDAARVFLDENRIEKFDELHSDFEDRFKIIGKVLEVLVVIYTEREDKNRIISARRADKDEKEEYYGQYLDL